MISGLWKDKSKKYVLSFFKSKSYLFNYYLARPITMSTRKIIDKTFRSWIAESLLKTN